MTKTPQEPEDASKVANTDPKSKKIKKSPKNNLHHPLSKKHRMRIEGHRGAGLLEPENTIKAFQKAIELEIDGVELDVWLSKDHVPVVVHGKNDGQIEFLNKVDLIENMTLEEIKVTTMLTGEIIPTLKEVLEVCKDKICVNIELKGTNLQVVEKVFQLLDELDMFHQISISSFYHAYYDEMNAVIEKLKIEERIYFGFLAYKADEMPDFTKGKEDDSFNLDIQLINSHTEVILENIKKAKDRKMRIKFYFPMKVEETEELYEKMLEVDTDTVITNQPVLLREYLEKKDKELQKSVASPLKHEKAANSTADAAQNEETGLEAVRRGHEDRLDKANAEQQQQEEEEEEEEEERDSVSAN